MLYTEGQSTEYTRRERTSRGRAQQSGVEGAEPLMISPISLHRNTAELEAKRARLEDSLRDLGSAIVAYSGGADSALLLRVAYDVLGPRAVGAIALSESIPADEVAAAVRVAEQEIGVTLYKLQTHEMERPEYRRNDADRCYYCKTELFDVLEPLAVQLGIDHILYGANHDDLGDHRPGQRAARERGVHGPLLDAGFTKAEVRLLSRQLGLSTWNKPAMACLSSRIPHGTPITRAALSMVEQAEACLHSLGLPQVRVRTYGTTARIEAPQSDLLTLVQPQVRAQVVQKLHEIGYDFITLDLEGFRSGSMNIHAAPGHA